MLKIYEHVFRITEPKPVVISKGSSSLLDLFTVGQLLFSCSQQQSATTETQHEIKERKDRSQLVGGCKKLALFYSCSNSFKNSIKYRYIHYTRLLTKIFLNTTFDLKLDILHNT